MNLNNLDNYINQLEQVQKVDAPPFLFTRIQQKINSSFEYQFSSKFVWSFGLSILFILLLNIAVIGFKINTKHQNNLVNAMQLSPTNEIYQ